MTSRPSPLTFGSSIGQDNADAEGLDDNTCGITELRLKRSAFAIARLGVRCSLANSGLELPQLYSFSLIIVITILHRLCLVASNTHDIRAVAAVPLQWRLSGYFSKEKCFYSLFVGLIPICAS